MADFVFQDMLALGADETPYRQLSAAGVSTFEAGGRTFLSVEPAALTLLAATAMRDIAHLFRPGHLAQLRHILEDPEASANDRFVAMELLKNACISAGGVLPSCQDTGTALVKAKKGQFVVTGGGDKEALARGIFTHISRKRENELRTTVESVAERARECIAARRLARPNESRRLGR